MSSMNPPVRARKKEKNEDVVLAQWTSVAGSTVGGCADGELTTLYTQYPSSERSFWERQWRGATFGADRDTSAHIGA